MEEKVFSVFSTVLMPQDANDVNENADHVKWLQFSSKVRSECERVFSTCLHIVVLMFREVAVYPLQTC